LNGAWSVKKHLKLRLTTAPILAHPNFSLLFKLDTDASQYGIDTVLSQKVDGSETVIAYASRTLTKSERQYSVTCKERLAVVHFLKYFKHYLIKRCVERTDHSTFRWLLQTKNPEGQIARWIAVVSAQDIEIEHRPGKYHNNADAFSRDPCRQYGYEYESENKDYKANSKRSMKPENPEGQNTK